MGGMSRFCAGVVLIACLVLACAWPAHAAEPMLLTDAKPTVSLSPAMRYSVDAHLDLRAEDLFGKIDSDYFQNLPKGDPTRSPVTSARSRVAPTTTAHPISSFAWMAGNRWTCCCACSRKVRCRCR